MSIVIDASITIAALSPDERADDTERYLDIISVDDMVAPAIWPLEIIHVLRRKVARGLLASDTAADALAAAQLLRVRLNSVSATTAFAEIGRLVHLHGLTPYDASYLHSALRLERPLASLDRQMRAAAAIEGIELLPD